MHGWGGKKYLTAPLQYLFLKANPNCEGDGGISAGKLIWRFQARPTPLSRFYKVRIKYRCGSNPGVFVEEPDLTLLAEGRELPHVYRKPLRLCLYMPSTGQWTPTKRIDQTIVPWTYTWLFYFEDWLAYGEWNGGGKHPGDAPELASNRRFRRSLAGSNIGNGQPFGLNNRALT